LEGLFLILKETLKQVLFWFKSLVSLEYAGKVGVWKIRI